MKKTPQDLYSSCLNRITYHRAREQVADVAGNRGMTQWHRGNISAFQQIANSLVDDFKCVRVEEIADGWLYRTRRT